MGYGSVNYETAGKWMSLAVWAEKEYQHWEKHNPEPHHSDYYYTMFLRQIAVEALNRGFSLRAGHRAYAVQDLLRAIAPNDTNLQAAFLRIDHDQWLTPQGARPSRRKSNG